mmetsp:Transcript_139800/g.363429  ORF Transcript_139800/g.363429 Transcript_139800/m.363429 type:complete len:81 (+) Transcript_139800:79-321(+)
MSGVGANATSAKEELPLTGLTARPLAPLPLRPAVPEAQPPEVAPAPQRPEGSERPRPVVPQESTFGGALDRRQGPYWWRM